MRRLPLAAALAALTLLPLPGRAAPAPTARPVVFDVGTAVVDVTPARPQYLGGFGYGDPVGGVHDPLEARAFFVAKGTKAVAFAIVDSQGWFAGYQEGPYGITDAREQAAAWLAGHGYPGTTPADIVVSATHSHAAPTVMGIWGRTDVEYLRTLHDRTIQAIQHAATNARPAELWAGTADVGAVDGSTVSQTDIYDGWTVDGDAPVLWAREPGTGRTRGLYVNVPIHADIVDGLDLGQMSADHIGYERDALEALLGGTAVVAMGTLGRQESIVQVGGFDRAEQVGRFVTTRVLQAMAAARPLTDPTVEGAEQYVVVPATNPLLAALNHGNTLPEQAGFYDVACNAACPIDRSTAPPYTVGAAFGTWVTSLRIGVLLYVSQPGEAFPEVSDAIRRSVTGARAVHFVAEAQDVLGYYWPAADVAFTQVLNDSDHLLYNASLELADVTAAASGLDAKALGFGWTPTPPTPGIVDPAARTKPGVQFFAVPPRSASPTVRLVAAVNTAFHGFDPAPAEAPESRLTELRWSFGDGTTLLATPNGKRSDVVHTFPRPGTYTVTATIVDDQGRTRTVSQQVVVDPAPAVRFTVSKPGKGHGKGHGHGKPAASATTVTASLTGGDGHVLAARWVLSDGRTFYGQTLALRTYDGLTARVTLVDGAGDVASAGITF